MKPVLAARGASDILGEIAQTALGNKGLSMLKLPKDFVIHSLRHTMLTPLGDAGADAFTIMRIAGHSSVTVSQRYVQPSPESLERAFERLEALNGKMNGRAANAPILRGPTAVSTTVSEALPVTR